MKPLRNTLQDNMWGTDVFITISNFKAIAQDSCPLQQKCFGCCDFTFLM